MIKSKKSGCSKILGESQMAVSHPDLRVMSNIPDLCSDVRSQQNFTNFVLDEKKRPALKILYLIKSAVRSYRYDVIFLDCALLETMVMCICKFIFPFNKCKIICSDPILRIPRSSYQKIFAALKRLILKKVDLFILYHKELTMYGKIYNISANRTVYVPFKVNMLSLIKKIEPAEGEYIFSGGVSLRDWETMALAMKELDIPLIISIPSDKFLSEYGIKTSLPVAEKFGLNTKIIRDEGTQEPWIRLIAGSKFVVLPILEESINASGISICLCAMALRKCVIITEGTTTKGILNESNCVIVPPNNPALLKRAIERVNIDQELRQRLAESGYQYAISCGDTERLYRDFVNCIFRIVDYPDHHYRIL